MAEFLPLCDVLFNVISLANYFCDIVFDLIMCYALLERGYNATFTAAVSFILISLIISQVLSLKWYLEQQNEKSKLEPFQWRLSRDNSVRYTTVMLHVIQVGVLWRYAQLFVPVNLTYVKHQVRNLCILRLIHAFCEAAPMLLLQIHVMLTFNNETVGERSLWELCVVSSWLSLFSICWALASFTKNVSRNNLHRLVLTWLGVIFQLLWRLGTVSARVMALSVYALLYKYWLLLVIGLHWVSMFLWIVSPRDISGSGNGNTGGDRTHVRLRTAAMLAVVYILAYININTVHHKHKMITFYLVMCIENSLLIWAWSVGSRVEHSKVFRVASCAALSFTAGIFFMLLYYRYFHVKRLAYTTDQIKIHQNDKYMEPTKAGVFNCRFTNPVTNNTARRKKKKPSNFVPPPPAFWRRPELHLHHGGSSENEGSSVGSRVNIQQKLQEKKQKQLAELRVIEEEIKQGKLCSVGGGVSADELYRSLQRQPVPRHKRQPRYQNIPALCIQHLNSSSLVIPMPHLEDCTSNSTHVLASVQEELMLTPRLLNTQSRVHARSDTSDSCDDSQHHPSDLESQMSLPRSYTLPREFRYVRRRKDHHNHHHIGGNINKVTERVLQSNNSSDGDVDSGDDVESEHGELRTQVRLYPRRQPHETKL